MKLKTGTIIFVIISLIVTIATCGIYAYLTSSDSITNILTIGDNNTSIEETFTPPESIKPGDTIKKEVMVKNNGSMPCYVWVSLLISNKNISDKIILNLNTTDWEQKADGYYYYKKVLPVGNTTTKLLSSVAIPSSVSVSEIGDFDIIVYSESVQQGNNNNYSDAWEVFADN